jgi:non-specific serine/threonine protein kinase/serine/threonine-protein kinase
VNSSPTIDRDPRTAQNQASSAALRRQLTGDLDEIVLMALRKEPDRRYASVQQFAEDIRNHLEGRPVAAVKGSWRYHARKFVTRHKIGVAATAAVLIALAAGVGATFREARVAAANERRAEERFNDVRKLANSLMFEVHDSIQDLPGATAARKLIVERAVEYLDSLGQESRGDPSLQRELAAAYKRIGDVQGGPFAANMGDTTAALKSYQKALEIRQSLLAANAGNLDDLIGMAEVSRLAAGALMVSGGTSVALADTQRAVQALESALPANPDNAKLMRELMRDYGAEADVLASNLIASNLGKLSLALPLRQKQLALAARLIALEPADPERQREYASVLGLMGDQLTLAGQRHEGKQYYISAQQTLEKLASGSNSTKLLLDVHDSYYRLVDVQLADGDLRATAASSRRALDIAQQISAADPANSQARLLLAADHSYLADALSRLGRKEEARDEMAKAMSLDADLMKHNPGSPEFSHMHVSRLQAAGDIYRRSGDYRQAAHYYGQGLDLLSAMWKQDPSNGGARLRRAFASNGMGFSLIGIKDLPGASEMFQQALGMILPDVNTDSPGEDALYGVADAYAGLAEIEALQAHWQQALALTDLSLKRWRQIKEPGLVGPNGFDCVSLSEVMASRAKYAAMTAPPRVHSGKLARQE